MENVYLVASVRTPIGRFGGTLASWSAADLGVAAANESLKRANLGPDQVQQSIWGCARQAGGGPNVARQITFRAGVPETVPAFTVNQACGSGLQAIMLAAQQIMLGRAEIVLAGGAESMSRVPYFAEGARWGATMGNTELVDGMYRDAQDEFALRSQQRAQAAIESGRFDAEIVPLDVQGRKGETTKFVRDEHCRFGTTKADLAKLPAVFSKDGTVSAGKSSGITDGAAAVVVMSEEALKSSGAGAQARIVDYEVVGVAPEIMGIGPVPAVRALLARNKVTLDNIDLIELNEAFAAQVIACDRELKFDPERLNVNGGAIAL